MHAEDLIRNTLVQNNHLTVYTITSKNDGVQLLYKKSYKSITSQQVIKCFINFKVQI